MDVRVSLAAPGEECKNICSMYRLHIEHTYGYYSEQTFGEAPAAGLPTCHTPSLTW
jgi:hypothetical protein